MSRKARPSGHIPTHAMAIALIFSAVSSSAAQIVNGDFSTGDLSGWTSSAINSDFDAVNADPYVHVAGLGSGNAASFGTGEFSDGLFLSSLAQSFTVSSDNPILSFDFTLPTIVSDTTGDGSSPISDAFFVLIDNAPEIFDLLLVDDQGPLTDPFSSTPFAVVLGPPSDAAFDFSLRADLSSLVGQEITLAFDLMQEDDGNRFAGLAISDIRLVPEPSSLLLVLIAIGAFLRQLRRR